MQQAEEQKRGRGRRPASELAEQREREIAALAATVARQQKRLEELKEAQRRAQKAARRTYLNQRKYAVGGLAQIAGLLEADPGFVLGLMLEAAEQRDRDGTWPSAVFEKYKHRGDQVLAERAAARKRRKSTGDDDEDDDVEFGPAVVPMQENRYQEGAH